MDQKHLLYFFLAVWFTIWPAIAVGAILFESWGWGVAGVAGMIVTMLGTLVALVREMRVHAQCHIRIQNIFTYMRDLNAFRLYEVRATELENLADQLREFPKAVLMPGPMASAIEDRVRQLRAAAPDPPPVPFGGPMEFVDHQTASAPS